MKTETDHPNEKKNHDDGSRKLSSHAWLHPMTTMAARFYKYCIPKTELIEKVKKKQT